MDERTDEFRVRCDRRTPPRLARFVYFLQYGEGLVKIGFTGDNVDRRVAGIRGMSPVPLTVRGIIHGGSSLRRRHIEHVLHARCAAWREHGEWFRPEGEVLSALVELERPGPCFGCRTIDEILESIRPKKPRPPEASPHHAEIQRLIAERVARGLPRTPLHRHRPSKSSSE